MKLRIDPEFSSLIPNHGDDAELEAAILADGRILNPLIVWKHQNTLLDGHRRNRLMTKHTQLKAPAPIVLDFESRQEANDWVIRHQLARRNVTDEQRKYLIGKLYSAKKPIQGQNLSSVKLTNDAQTAAAIAESEGISEKSVHRAAEFAEAVDAAPPEVKKLVLEGEVSATTAALEQLAELPAWQRNAAAEAIAEGEVSSVAAAIAAVAPKKEPAVLDALKGPLPKSLHEVFSAVTKFRSAMKHIGDAKGALKKLVETAAGGYLDIQEIERHLEQARSLVRFAMPHTECPKCRRKLDKKCPACKGHGWIHEMMLKTSGSDADKKWLEARK